MATRLERILEELDTLANKECWGDVSEEVKGRCDAFAKSADVVRTRMETEDQSRQRFEAWRISQGDDQEDLIRHDCGEYVDYCVRIMRQAWQASQIFTEASE